LVELLETPREKESDLRSAMQMDLLWVIQLVQQLGLSLVNLSVTTLERLSARQSEPLLVLLWAQLLGLPLVLLFHQVLALELLLA
jgi:hypothetical protein